MGEQGTSKGDIFVMLTTVVFFGFLIGVVFIITHQPERPSIYEDGTYLPLIRYIESQGYATVEELDDYFTDYGSRRSAILKQLEILNDDNYVERVFEEGLYYYRLTEWGIVYLDYLEARVQ